MRLTTRSQLVEFDERGFLIAVSRVELNSEKVFSLFSVVSFEFSDLIQYLTFFKSFSQLTRGLLLCFDSDRGFSCGFPRSFVKYFTQTFFANSGLLDNFSHKTTSNKEKTFWKCQNFVKQASRKGFSPLARSLHPRKVLSQRFPPGTSSELKASMFS